MENMFTLIDSIINGVGGWTTVFWLIAIVLAIAGFCVPVYVIGEDEDRWWIIALIFAVPGTLVIGFVLLFAKEYVEQYYTPVFLLLIGMYCIYHAVLCCWHRFLAIRLVFTVLGFGIAGWKIWSCTSNGSFNAEELVEEALVIVPVALLTLSWIVYIIGWFKVFRDNAYSSSYSSGSYTRSSGYTCTSSSSSSTSGNYNYEGGYYVGGYDGSRVYGSGLTDNDHDDLDDIVNAMK